uniref:Calponin-homology (CH) domain-containing protein n=1 Tax=Steinernema glaseri TaxID=37863 RepID=A0A1I7ZNM3_9BILA
MVLPLPLDVLALVLTLGDSYLRAKAAWSRGDRPCAQRPQVVGERRTTSRRGKLRTRTAKITQQLLRNAVAQSSDKRLICIPSTTPLPTIPRLPVQLTFGNKSPARGERMSLWRKIQRTNKKAAKYRFNLTLNDLLIDGNDGWQPEQIIVALMHRRRRYETKPRRVEPSFADKCRCLVVWPEQAPDFIDVLTTLYKDQRNQQFDDKEWTLVIEEVTPKRKNRPLAAVALNLRMFINDTPGEKTELKMKLRPLREEVKMCLIKFVIDSHLLKEGDAVDDDMQSIASGISESASIDDLIKASSSEKVEPMTPEHKEAVADIAKVSDEIEQRFAKKEKPDSPKSPLKSREDFFKPPSPPQLIRPPWREVAEKKKTSVESPQSPVAPASAAVEIQPETQPEVTLREKTPKLQQQPLPELIPNEELIDWCKRIAREYKFLKITDFTKSFKSGLAFCALIHRYRPELIGDITQIRHNGNPKDNCTKAFSVAEQHLGIKSTLDVNDVVMCPEKNKVKAYVERLRHALEGTTPTDVVDAARMSDYRLCSHPFFGLSESEEKVMLELQKLKDRNMEADAVDYSDVPETTDGGDVKYAAVVPGISSPQAVKPVPVQSTPLMTRKQLNDPFGSDNEETPKPLNGFESPSKSNNTPLNIKLESLSGTANQSELRQRARQLLANPEAMLGGSFSPSKDDERSKRLLEEARQRIEEAKTEGGTFNVSGQSAGFHRSASSRSSLHGSSTDIRTLGIVEKEVNFYKFSKRQPSPVLQRKNYDTPSIPACARPSQRTVNTTLGVNGPSALDRVKRYGSMRRQELTEAIQLFVAGSTIDSSSNEYPVNDVHSTPTRKLTNDWERDAQDPSRIESELGKITMRMAQLEKENMEINEKIRDVVQGSNEETKLIEALIKCTGERDKLQKKVDYYNDVLTIIEVTESIDKKRQELDEVTDEFKTEEEKNRIDKLMNELRELTDQKMHLTLKVGNVHSEEEEHDEQLRRTLDRTQNLGSFQRGVQEPLSASKRIYQWLRS